MFYRGRIEQLEMHVEDLKSERIRLQDQIFKLEGRISRILDHLGVQEVSINKTVLEKKGGPEKPL